MELKAPWLKYYNGIRTSLVYPESSISEVVFEAAEKYPDNIALLYMNSSVTYRCMAQKVKKLQSALEKLGVKPGDKVAVCLPNIPQAVYCLYAINRMGAVASFLHPLSAVAELGHYIKELGANYIVALDSLYPVFEKVLKSTGEKTLIVTSPADELSSISRFAYRISQKDRAKTQKKKNIINWKALMKTGDASSVSAKKAAKDLSVVLFSGGTTGVPKGVMLSNLSINAMALQTIEMSHCEVPGRSMLAAMPMFHGFGLGVCVHTMLIQGGCSILVPRFTVEEYAKLIKKHRPNFIAGVPTLFEALTRNSYLDGTDLSCLSGVFSGGDTLPETLKKKFDGYLKDHGAQIRIREGYGATECVTASCLTPYDTEREGSIGLPFPDMFYKICKVGTTQELPFGEEGEICITGPSVMMGYLNSEDESKKVLRIHPDGYLWLHSGDIGIIDQDGFVYFRQRIKRIIITSGYNVYPAQIERVLDSHRAVHHSCAVGVKDTYKMNRIKAYVVLNDDYEANESTKNLLMEHLVKNIARYAIPKEIEFRDSLPVTKVGKIAYRELEQEANSNAQNSDNSCEE